MNLYLDISFTNVLNYECNFSVVFVLLFIILLDIFLDTNKAAPNATDLV